MDFEKMLQDNMDMVTKKVEAGLEHGITQTNFPSEELENIVRRVVKEELAIVVKDVKKFLEKAGNRNLNNGESNSRTQETSSSNSVRPNIAFNQKVSYNIREEARYRGMTCGGWTFFANSQEGNHLWAVNGKGTEYYELYPKTISRVEKIEEGYVYFIDTDFRRFRVCISSGKIEKVNR